MDAAHLQEALVQTAIEGQQVGDKQRFGMRAKHHTLECTIARAHTC